MRSRDISGRRFRTTILLLATAATSVGLSYRCLGLSASQTDSEPKGRNWALLVGVDNYRRTTPLPYSANDVGKLAATLRDQGQYSDECILEMTDRVSDPEHQPLKANLQNSLTQWLKKAGPEDSVLVYFSGHGFRDPQQRMYLAPLDCDPENLENTGISVVWFQEQIKNCPAAFKLLVLDTCHAGSEKSAGRKEAVVAADLGEPFRRMAGVVTLASCKAHETSQLWDEKQQSLFSYWLNQGLRGHADADGDGLIDVDELYKYVQRHVAATVKGRMIMAQTPARIIRSDAPDEHVVVRLKPRSLRSLLAEIAGQFADTLDQRQMKKAVVMEFTSKTPLGELLGQDYGALGQYCAEYLEHELLQQAAERYGVVDRRQLHRALAERDFTVRDLGSAQALKALSARAGGFRGLGLGTFTERKGRVLNLVCELHDVESGEVADSGKGSVLLSDSEWGMLGRSVRTKPDDYRGDVQSPEEWDQRAKGAHPMSDPACPYRVKIMVGGEERKPRFEGNDCIVKLNKGETYEIWVENKTDRVMLMRLLVDGLNTLLEKETTKGAGTYVVGKRVNLDEARPWVLDPADTDPRIRGLFAVRGFATELGAGGKIREFTVVDAQESLAARRKFTSQIGLITAAFYVATDVKPKSVGTAAGQERQEPILYNDKELWCGNSLAVIHVRYTD